MNWEASNQKKSRAPILKALDASIHRVNEEVKQRNYLTSYNYKNGFFYLPWKVPNDIIVCELAAFDRLILSFVFP